MPKSQNKKARPFLVVELLNSFSKRELADFVDFASCTYHNTDAHVVALLNVLRKEVIQKRDFDDVAQCIAYRATFPKKAAPKNILNQQQKGSLLAKMTILIRLAEAFLTYEAVKENMACKIELLYEQLLSRNQFWLFNRHVTRDSKTLESKLQKGVEDYASQFKMQSKILHYLHQKELIITEDNLPELTESLDIHYLINKLKIHVTCISLENFSLGRFYDYTSIDATVPLLKLPQYANHPLIHTYQAAIDLLKDNTIESYQKLIELLNINETYIADEDLNNFYKIAISSCIRRVKEGQVYYGEIFELFQIMDNKNLLIEGSFMQAGKLKNIITVSCKVGEFDWAKETIEKYRPNLEKEHAESVYHFNMGAVAFYQNDFKTALSHFIRVEKVNLAYDINCRIMLLKSHYELDEEYDERTIRTFLMSERFIQSHKGLIPRDKKAYKNFVRILINIYNTRHGNGKMTAEKIKRKLEKLEFVSDKKWLEAKIEALDNK